MTSSPTDLTITGCLPPIPRLDNNSADKQHKCVSTAYAHVSDSHTHAHKMISTITTKLAMRATSRAGTRAPNAIEGTQRYEE